MTTQGPLQPRRTQQLQHFLGAKQSQNMTCSKRVSQSTTLLGRLCIRFLDPTINNNSSSIFSLDQHPPRAPLRDHCDKQLRPTHNGNEQQSMKCLSTLTHCFLFPPWTRQTLSSLLQDRLVTFNFPPVVCTSTQDRP